MTLRPLRPHFTLAIYEQGTSTGLTGLDVAPNGSESRFAAPDQIPDIRPFCGPWRGENPEFTEFIIFSG